MGRVGRWQAPIRSLRRVLHCGVVVTRWRLGRQVLRKALGQENSGSGPFPPAGWFHSPLENSEPSCQAPRRGHAQRPRWACRNGWRAKRLGFPAPPTAACPQAQTPADPDADMRAWLRSYATKHPCHGFRRAWAALRHDEGREVNVKKMHRLWREEGLQGGFISPRKRAGTSSVPQVDRRRPEGGVGDRLPVRLHHRRQGDQDRLDGRRTHP